MSYGQNCLVSGFVGDTRSEFFNNCSSIFVLGTVSVESKLFTMFMAHSSTHFIVAIRFFVIAINHCKSALYLLKYDIRLFAFESTTLTSTLSFTHESEDSTSKYMNSYLITWFSSATTSQLQ